MASITRKQFLAGTAAAGVSMFSIRRSFAARRVVIRFGLDLTSCAATGDTENLIYVSPKSGRAVSAAAGKPYAGRLFPLPQFLLGAQNEVGTDDITAGLALTGHFLFDRVLKPNGKAMPSARLRLDSLAGHQDGESR